uniref:CMP/dCMP-type deaminase domain-containing protein n=1 Tax=Anopheles coluzzii TaxID=1518534 RepID=A0A8W7PHM9_ANOCL
MSTEPETKRPKLIVESGEPPSKIRSILGDEFTQPTPVIEVYIGRVAENRHLSQLVPALARILPIGTLQHLKRVNRDGTIILAPVVQLLEKLPVESAVCEEEQANSIESRLSRFLLSEGIDRTIVDGLCGQQLKVMPVPATQPLLRWQYEAANKLWPCKFHPNRHHEALYADTLFGAQEAAAHRRFMEICLQLSAHYESRPFGVCVHPRSAGSRIVAIGGGSSDRHPIWHCPMVLIDMVAVSQNGGIWHRKQDDVQSDAMPAEGGFQLDGIDPQYRRFVRERYGDTVCLGAEPTRTGTAAEVDVAGAADDNLAKYGPYLCTGYDVYLTHEPCIMCAMALVHSRVRRVFFHRPTPGRGALGTLVKLHAVKELNHHYEVFRIV